MDNRQILVALPVFFENDGDGINAVRPGRLGDGFADFGNRTGDSRYKNRNSTASLKIHQRGFATQPRVEAAATTLGSWVGKKPSKQATMICREANSQRFGKQVSAQALRPQFALRFAPLSSPSFAAIKLVTSSAPYPCSVFVGLESQGSRCRSNPGLRCTSLSGKIDTTIFIS